MKAVILKPAFIDPALREIQNTPRHRAPDKSDRPLFTAGTAYQAAMEVIAVLQANGALRLKVAGSLRREHTTVRDVDILCIASDSNRCTLALKQRSPSIWAGPGKAAFTWPLPDGREIHVDVRYIEPESWGSCLQHFTGSFEHNVTLRVIAKNMGLRANEYGVFRGSERVDDGTEQGYYKALGLRWLPPRFRDGFFGPLSWRNKPYQPRPTWCIDHTVLDFCKRGRALAKRGRGI